MGKCTNIYIYYFLFYIGHECRKWVRKKIWLVFTERSALVNVLNVSSQGRVYSTRVLFWDLKSVFRDDIDLELKVLWDESVKSWSCSGIGTWFRSPDRPSGLPVSVEASESFGWGSIRL